MVSVGIVTRGMLEQERKNGRVIMGYILGMAIIGYFMSNLFRYAAEFGEPVNVFEAFCMIEQQNVNLLFLVIGWLLVVADAPFIKGNTYLILYRCGRKSWNYGMLSYILVQAFVYTAVMAAFTVIVSSFYGYAGDMWSSPIYALAKNTDGNLGIKYNVDFPWINIMQNMTVPQAFAVTVLFFYLYLAFMGVLLYVASLLFSGIVGVVAVIAVHLGGYLLQQDGMVTCSLFARAVPGNFVDGTASYLKSAMIFLLLMAALALLSAVLVKKVEYHAGAEVDG